MNQPMQARTFPLGFPVVAMRLGEKRELTAILSPLAPKDWRPERLVILPGLGPRFMVHDIRSDNETQFASPGNPIPLAAFDGSPVALSLSTAKSSYTIVIERVPYMKHLPWWMYGLQLLRLRSKPKEPEHVNFTCALFGTTLVPFVPGAMSNPDPLVEARKRLNALEMKLRTEKKLDEAMEDLLEDLRTDLDMIEDELDNEDDDEESRQE